MKELLIAWLVFSLIAYLLAFWFWCAVLCSVSNPFGRYKIYACKKPGMKDYYRAKVFCGKLFGIIPIWISYKECFDWVSIEMIEEDLKEECLKYKAEKARGEKELIIIKNLEREYFKD